MVFSQKRVFLGLTLVLLAHSVNGGPLCVAACNALWVTCVAGLTCISGGAAAGPPCDAAYVACVQMCNGPIPPPIFTGYPRF